MRAIAKYNGVNAYTVKPFNIDTREVDGFYTPNQIVQTNLNYSYDFANPNSYIGSGTTTNSLVSGYTGTINGSPTYNSTGWFECDAVNDYITLGGWTRPTTWSLGVWFKFNWSALTNNVLSLYDTRLGTANNGLRLTCRDVSGVKVLRSRMVNQGSNENIDLDSTSNGSVYFDSTKWYYYAISRNNSTNITIWLSNPSTGNLTELANITPVAGVLSNTMSGNTYGAGDQIGSFFDGNLGELHEYTTNLSLTDFQQNFNNTKKRYGY